MKLLDLVVGASMLSLGLAWLAFFVPARTAEWLWLAACALLCLAFTLAWVA